MKKQMYIDGQWVEALSKEVTDIINPYNQEVIATVPRGNIEDTRTAIQAAKNAFENSDWRNTSAYDRSCVLYQIAEKIREKRVELAEAETLNTGKTLTESLADMDGIAMVFQYYAGLADKNGGEIIPSPNASSTSKVVREPVGVCGQILPWNYPLLQASWKIAPALAAGNAVVVKPSEITPLTTLMLAEIIHETPLPNGVFNVVLGPGSTVGHEIAINKNVDLISFTGGGEAGREIMKAASVNFKKISLELGGKNPNLVFKDANLTTALDYALNAVFFHAGQVCSAGARLLIEEDIHDEFVEKIIARAAQIKMGNGFDESTQMGPVISKNHLKTIEKYISTGINEGATLMLGGKRPTSPHLQDGFFIEPTVFTNCHKDMHIVREESFGPILTVEKFASEDEAITLANDSVYGLAGALWTQDMNRAERVAGQLRMGTVWINDYHPYFPQAPWGGYKQSGIGRELGHMGLEEYTEVKHVYMNLDPKPMNWFG